MPSSRCPSPRTVCGAWTLGRRRSSHWASCSGRSGWPRTENRLRDLPTWEERKHCMLMLKSSIQRRGSTDIKPASQPRGQVKRSTERKWVNPQNNENNKIAKIPPLGNYTIVKFQMIQLVSSCDLQWLWNASCKIKQAGTWNKTTQTPHKILITWRRFLHFQKKTLMDCC